MRAMWSGAISFGLINIPVKLYSASEEKELAFHFLHQKDMSTIRFARVCKTEEREVPYEELVRGYERSKGEYVVMADEDFAKANLHKTKTIDILDFVKETEVDTLYFEKPYFLEPEENSEKAYVLLREALRRSKKIGIAKFVLRNKEHLASVSVRNKVILLNQMKFAEELRKPDELRLPDAKNLRANELEMALKLVEQLSVAFKPENYRDTYTRELKEIIAEKAKGKPIRARGREPEATRVEDLMSILQASLKSKRKQIKTRS